MPGDRKHHTAKFRSCVEKVMADGKSEDAAYAICTTSLQEAGEEIFEAAEEIEESRQLHLVGCASKATVRTENGVEYIVVPVVALMEGVIHAVNAETPEFVPLSTLKEAAESWNGKPVTIGHPVKNGKQCSASAPEILEAHGIGQIRNSHIEGSKLLQEAWVEKSRVKKLHPEMHDRLLDAQHEEVSVGAFVVTGDKESDYKGKKYKKEWLRTSGDHLAFLPGGRGACSLEMGCGAHRAVSHFVAAEEFISSDDVLRLLNSNNSLEIALWGRAFGPVFSTLQGKSLDERISAVNTAVQKKWNTNPLTIPSESIFAYAVTVFDDRVIVRKSDSTGEKLFSISYTVADGQVTFGDDLTEVKQTYVAAAGARHSHGDTKMIQDIHDHACKLGASCDRKNLEALAEPRIRHEGGQWVLYSSDGLRRLATHDTEAAAQEQERAIEAAKHRRILEIKQT